MKTGSQYMVPLFLLLAQVPNIPLNKTTSGTATFTSSVASSTHAPHPQTEEPSPFLHPQLRRCLLKKAYLKAAKPQAIVEQYTSKVAAIASFLEYAVLTAAQKVLLFITYVAQIIQIRRMI